MRIKVSIDVWIMAANEDADNQEVSLDLWVVDERVLLRDPMSRDAYLSFDLDELAKALEVLKEASE